MIGFLRTLFGAGDSSAPQYAKAQDARLLLLSKFVTAGSASGLGNQDGWASALGCSPAQAAEQLGADGMLEPAEGLEILPVAFSAKKLKEMARERGLAVSGTKPVLAKRLIEHDPSVVSCVGDEAFFRCTDVGRAAVKEFEDRERHRRGTAETDCIGMLERGRFREAFKTMAAYEADCVFQRGIGIDWASTTDERETQLLTILFNERLERHSDLPDDTIRQLKIAAAMMSLWGTNNPGEWIPDDLFRESDLELAEEARLMHASAHYQVRILEFLDAGINKVEISGSGIEACMVCQKQEGRKYRLDKVPRVPFQGCSCDTWYQFTLLPNV